MPGPYAFSVGTRAHIDRVLEWGWNRAVVFRCHEQHRVVCLYLLAKRRPRGPWVSAVVNVLVVEPQLANLDDFRLQRVWSGCDQCLCDFPAAVPSVKAIWESWSRTTEGQDAGAGDQWTVPEMWRTRGEGNDGYQDQRKHIAARLLGLSG